jgi:drug/metabolite transporter (DMT)-like permease
MQVSNVSSNSARWRVLAALVTVYIVWGSTYLAIRFADETLPPLLTAGTRFLIAGAALYVWLRARGATRPSTSEWRAGLVVGALLLLLGNGGVVWSELTLPSSIVALLVGSVPLWMAVFDWLRPGGRRPHAGVFAGLLCGFAGIALLVGPTDLAGGAHLNLASVAVVLVAAMCWAAGSLYSRSGRLPANPFMGTAVEMLAGGALLVLVGSLTGEWSTLHIHAFSSRSLLSLVYLILIGSLVGFTAYIWLLRNTTAVVASTYAYVNPVVAVFLGWAFARESVTPRTLLAAAVIVAGVVVITSVQARANRAAKRDEDAPPLAEAGSGIAAETPTPRG